MFGPYDERIYNAIIRKLGLSKLPLEEKLNRLEGNLSPARYSRLIQEVSNILDSDIDVNQNMNVILQKYSKFNGGRSFLIKTRKLDISKYNNALNKNYPPESFIDHVGIFFNTERNILHYTPEGVKYGIAECDKEESSYDWNIHELNRHGALFTLRSFNEIKLFIERWERYFRYNSEFRSSELFGYTLAYWLVE